MRRQAGGGEDRRRRGDDYEEDCHQGEGQPDQRQNQAQRQAGGGEDRRRRGDDYEEDRHQGEGQPNQRQIQAQRPSSGLQLQPHQLPPLTRNVDYVVKEHLSAAITCLDQELQSLQKELDELETMESASAACQEVITSTEGKPDPLLPITSGPENSSWDRWFQRVRSRSNKWWASKGSDFS